MRFLERKHCYRVLESTREKCSRNYIFHIIREEMEESNTLEK